MLDRENIFKGTFMLRVQTMHRAQQNGRKLKQVDSGAQRIKVGHGAPVSLTVGNIYLNLFCGQK